MRSVDHLLDIDSSELQEYQMIGIDEGQFFPDLVIAVTHWVEELNKHVVVAGLNGDSQRRRFGQILDLIPICDNIHKLSSYCLPCSQRQRLVKALFSYRMGTDDRAQVLVGGHETFNPVCRSCYLAMTDAEAHHQ
jgi:thymidine kinase